MWLENLQFFENEVTIPGNVCSSTMYEMVEVLAMHTIVSIDGLNKIIFIGIPAYRLINNDIIDSVLNNNLK